VLLYDQGYTEGIKYRPPLGEYYMELAPAASLKNIKCLALPIKCLEYTLLFSAIRISMLSTNKILQRKHIFRLATKTHYNTMRHIKNIQYQFMNIGAEDVAKFLP